MRYCGLTLLKGLSAFGIVGCHLFLSPMTSTAKSLLHFCDLGVALFGVMSGFFLAMSYAQKERVSLCNLITHKARRIFPAYFAWTVIFLLASPTFNYIVRHKTMDPRYFEAGYWASALFFGGSSTHLWYLAWLFWWSVALYLLWKSHRIFQRPVVLICLSCLSLYLCVRVCSAYCDYGLRLFVFMTLGAALYSLRSWWAKIPFWAMGGLTCVALCAHIVMPFHAYVRDYFAALFVVPFFLLMNPRNKIVSMAGDLSFGVYLIHPLLTMFFSVLSHRFIGTPTSAMVLACDWVLVFVVSCFLVFTIRKFKRLEWVVA